MKKTWFKKLIAGAMVGLLAFAPISLASIERKAKVSSNDSTAGFLNGKLVAGNNVTFQENNDGENETLTINATSAAAYNTVQEEGTNLTQRNNINFIGSEINCVDNAGQSRTDCTVASSGGATTEAQLEAALTDVTNVITDNDAAGGDLSGNYPSPSVVDDSHAHIITNVDAFTEVELQTQLSDVTDVFTNNDGALNDDNLSDNNITDLSDVDVTTPADGQLLIRDQSTDVRFENVSMSGDATITALGVIEVTEADALEVNGANCSTGQAPEGVDAAGAVENCNDFILETELDTEAELQGQLTDVSDVFTNNDTDFVDQSRIADDAVQEEHLKAVDTPADEDIVTYEVTTGDFEYHTCAEITGSADLCDGNDATGGGGTPNILDLGDDASNESTDLIEIATTGDTNNIFTEPSADKLLIAVGSNWPTADAATALSANGANCSAGNYPLGVDAAGAVESCTADDDVPEAADYSNLTGGRSITNSPTGTLAADAELFTRISSVTLENPAAVDDALVQLKFATAFTVTRVSCSTDVGTVDIQFDERAEGTPNTSGTDVMTAALQCTTSTANTTSFTNAGIAADAPMSLDIDAVASSPGVVRIHVDGTFDD